MRKVDRSLCPKPLNWADRVDRSLRDPTEFRMQAAAFQKLGLNSQKRRKGFAAFAPHVLVRNRSGRMDFQNMWGRHKEVIAAMSFHKCAYCEGPSNGPPLLAHRRRASFIVVVEVARPGEPGCSVPRAPLAAARGNARFLSTGSRHRESPSPNHFSRSLGGPKQVAPTGDPPKHKCAPRPRIIVNRPKTL